MNNIIPMSSFGLDYFDIFNNIIKSLLYPIPTTSQNDIRNLSKIPNTRIFYIINQIHKLKISIIEIIPKTKYDKVLIYTHGNGCDIYTFYPYLRELANNLGVLIVCWDYPQYGLSEGELCEFTCTQSLKDIIEYYKKKTTKILLVGHSLGTGIIIDYISNNNNEWTNPVILISPYKSIPTVIVNNFLIDYLVGKHCYCSWNKISNAKCPIKIFHGKSDNIINITHGQELFEIVSNKSLYPIWFENTGHNDILDKIAFYEYKLILDMLV